MRDALMAATTLDIFNQHSDRVVMANLAQMVNVIHSIILTDGPDMVLTPTYFVFDLYKKHQDAMLLDSWQEDELIGDQEGLLADSSHTASMKDGKLTLTVSNISPFQKKDVDVYILGYQPTQVSARILKAPMEAHNTFENKETVKIQDWNGVSITDQGLHFQLPETSVVEIILKNKEDEE